MTYFKQKVNEDAACESLWTITIKYKKTFTELNVYDNRTKTKK